MKVKKTLRVFVYLEPAKRLSRYSRTLEVVKLGRGVTVEEATQILD